MQTKYFLFLFTIIFHTVKMDALKISIPLEDIPANIDQSLPWENSSKMKGDEGQIINTKALMKKIARPGEELYLLLPETSKSDIVTLEVEPETVEKFIFHRPSRESKDIFSSNENDPKVLRWAPINPKTYKKLIQYFETLARLTDLNQSLIVLSAAS